jgi:hypothetical protein
MSVESDGGMILTEENRRTLRKTCPSATLNPTTNPTWIDPGANPDLRGERPATNDLNHGTAVEFEQSTVRSIQAKFFKLLFAITSET